MVEGGSAFKQAKNSPGSPGSFVHIVTHITECVTCYKCLSWVFVHTSQLCEPEAGGLDTMLHRAGVFARMSPDDKRLLVELLGEGALAEDGTEMPGLGNFVGEEPPVLIACLFCFWCLSWTEQ